MITAPLNRRPLYQHRQTGWPMLLSACVPFLCLAAWLWVVPPMNRTLPPLLADWRWIIPSDDRTVPPHLVTLIGGFALAVLGFSWMTVVLTPTHLVLRFGIGLFRRTILLSQVRRVLVTRTRWYEGWGIHWTRRGMLYNVGGFDAIAVELDNGKTLRIGSDDAARLQRAIERAIADLGKASRSPTTAR